MATQKMGLATKAGMTKAASTVLVVGATAAVTKVGTDALVMRLFVRAASETPRTADEEKMVEVYRGGVQVVGGLLIGKLLYKSAPKVAIGVAVGGVAGGVLRVMDAYDWDTSITDALSADTAAAGIYGASQARQLGARRETLGPIVRERVTVMR